MKLNNKGFAITGILYGLLILFALLVGSYLTVLTAKKNRLDGIVENIENEYNERENVVIKKEDKIIEDSGGKMTTLNYTTDGDCICTFFVKSEAYGEKECMVEIKRNVKISFDGSNGYGSIKADGTTIEFTDGECDQANAFENFKYITKLVIKYK